MPATQHALLVTDAYRRRVAMLRDHAQRTVARNWATVSGEDLDITHAAWVALTAPALTELQRGGARLSSAYLTAFISAEHGHRVVPGPPPSDSIGVSRAGKPMADALTGSLIAVKVAITAGAALDAALAVGLADAARNANEDIAFTVRDTLSAAMRASDQVTGWRRVTSGGCGACLAAADGEIVADDSDLEIHDHCQCTAEPVVKDAPDTVQRDTGHEMFQAMTQEQQDKALGPDAAQLVRDGQVPFRDLIGRSPMDAIADQITQAPIGALHH